MFLFIRMAVLYPLFAWLATSGLVIFDPVTGAVNIQFALDESTIMGVLGYITTWVSSRWSKDNGGAT